MMPRLFVGFYRDQERRKGTCLVTILAFQLLSQGVVNAAGYIRHNLVSDLVGKADMVDTNLVNPWGITTSASSPFWISDNHTGLSTIYTTTGAPLSLVVTIPPPAGASGPAAPTGVVFNGTTNFVVTGGPAHFIFATEDGTISGWNGGTNAILKVDNSASGTVYKGLAIANVGSATFIYATDFHRGAVDIFDGNFKLVTPEAFKDPQIPAGFAPFGIQNIGGDIYVTYAKQDAVKHDDVSGPGNGYVDVYDASGNLRQRLIAGGPLNSPWGMTVASPDFGPFSNALLVGNFGDGKINAFNPATGTFLGPISDSTGQPIVTEGLWGLIMGNGGKGGDTNTLYFTAGISGGGSVEDHGLFGSVSTEPIPFISFRQHNLVSDLAGKADVVDTNLVNPWGITLNASSPFWISDNHTGLSTVYSSTGAIQSLVVTIPPPAGAAGPAAPTGVVFNGTTNFVVTGGAAHFIFAAEDGTISGWNNGTNAMLKVDNSASGAVYKGLAIGSVGSSSYLYAANFHSGAVDVFDGNFKPALHGTFQDPDIPAGFAPFGIQNIGGNIYVTYAKQDAAKHDDVSGPGNGYVDIFDASGNLRQRLVSGQPLNSPWGMTLAPTNFAQFSGALLIGDFGDGKINAFNPATGAYLGSLKDGTGQPISVEGLWGLIFGNGAKGGDTNTIYFTAGISGGGSVEDHGLFGSLSAIATPRFTSTTRTGNNLTLKWTGGALLQHLQRKVSFSDPKWVEVLSTTNGTATVPINGAANFLRLSDQ